MASTKQLVRQRFRDACFARDRHRCRVCNSVPPNGDDGLDAHHITDRNEMPNGGYVKENGISLCAPCHEKAEVYHASSKATSEPGYSPDDLYRYVGSSYDSARRASERLR